MQVNPFLDERYNFLEVAHAAPATSQKSISGIGMSSMSSPVEVPYLIKSHAGLNAADCD